jgi:hypothetical protein
MTISREFHHDFGMWESWFAGLKDHPLYDADIVAKGLALYAFYYCDHAGHRTLSASEYAAAIEAVIPNSSVNFNILLLEGEWVRWSATWAGLFIKHAIGRHRGINRMMSIIEHRRIDPITPRAFMIALIGGCRVFDALQDGSVEAEDIPKLSDEIMANIELAHHEADVTWSPTKR